MTRRHLLLVRHALAAWHSGNASDFDRGLTATGRRDADELAAWLGAHSPCPQAIMSSPARRAHLTAERLAAAWPESPPILLEPGLYEAPLEAPVGLLSGLKDAWHHVLVVGHNPSLSHCADWLIGEPTVVELPPGGLVWLEIDATHWRDLIPGCARTHALQPPVSVISNQ